ncbi:MAG: histidine phosphatase family protein [Leptospiraceae bacterium]|nr:histidine phosphatase family protein [Leptospiraceae bacterium]MCB1202238.1 histidine phosphatase family protein [Leptospiraceae bacterium]
MLTLGILRHAKSEWGNPQLDDFNRPLNERGKTEADSMGSALAKLNLAPDVWISSTAIRARETTSIISQKMQFKKAIAWDPELYLCTAGKLYEQIRKTETSASSVLVVGHNPGLEEFVSSLVATGPALIRITTCCLAIIELSVPVWSDLKERKGTLKALVSGKMIKKLWR